MPIDGGLADAGLGGDLFQIQVGEVFFGQKLARGVQDGAVGGLAWGAPAPLLDLLLNVLHTRFQCGLVRRFGFSARMRGAGSVSPGFDRHTVYLR